MTEHRKDIIFTIIYEGGEQVIKTYLHEYRNLMVLLKNAIYLENFGECGGMGRCATCLIKITSENDFNYVLERNEKVTLSKMGIVNYNIRLSCQVLITAELNNMTIEINGEEYNQD